MNDPQRLEERIDQLGADCIECLYSKKRLNDDIVKLKNFVAKHRPDPYRYKKTIEAHRQYDKDLKEWDDLMRL